MLRLITDYTWNNSTSPYTVDDLREHARINTTAEDGFLDSYIEEAVQPIERETGKSILPRVWAEDLADFSIAYLQRNPVSEVTHIKYYDSSDDLQTLDTDQYHLHLPYTAKATVHFTGLTLPSLSVYRPYPVTITYEAGYDTVPEFLLGAIRVVATHLYKKRQGEPWEAGIDRILGRLKTLWVV